MANETIQGLKRVSFLPDREDGLNGTLIGGQEYDNVNIIGGEISGVSVQQALTITNKTDSYTLALTDADDYVRMNKATANNLTVPPHATVAFPVGTQILIRQVGIGTTTLVAGAGVTLNTPSTLNCRFQGSSVAIVQVAMNEWDVMGDLEPL